VQKESLKKAKSRARSIRRAVKAEIQSDSEDKPPKKKKGPVKANEVIQTPDFREERAGLISLSDLHSFEQQLATAEDSLLAVKVVQIEFWALVTTGRSDNHQKR